MARAYWRAQRSTRPCDVRRVVAFVAPGEADLLQTSPVHAAHLANSPTTPGGTQRQHHEARVPGATPRCRATSSERARVRSPLARSGVGRAVVRGRADGPRVRLLRRKGIRTPTRCDLRASRPSSLRPPPLSPASTADEITASRHDVASPKHARPRSSRSSTASRAEILSATTRAVRPAVAPRDPRGGYPRGPCCRQNRCSPSGCDTRGPPSWIARSRRRSR